MASVTHKKVLVIADDNSASAAGEVLPSDWNNDHSVSLAAADISALGFITSASISTADYVTSNSLSVRFTAYGAPAGFQATVSFGANVQFAADVIAFGPWTFDKSVTFSSTVIFKGTITVSATASVGALKIGGHAFNISLSQSVATGQVLTYNNVDNKWRNVTPATGTTLLGLTDVSLSQSVATGQVLTYDNVDNKWKNVTPTVSGGGKIDGTTGFSGVNFFKMSADWTTYQALELDIQAKGAATTTNLIIALYSDGGTVPFMTFATNPVASATASELAASFQITGTRNQNAMKVVFPRYQMFNGVTNQAGQFPTATFTTSAINAIGIITGAGTTTTTMSSADIFLYGRGV